MHALHFFRLFSSKLISALKTVVCLGRDVCNSSHLPSNSRLIVSAMRINTRFQSYFEIIPQHHNERNCLLLVTIWWQAIVV